MLSNLNPMSPATSARMERESKSGAMVPITTDSLRMESNKEKVSTSGLTAASTPALGTKTR